MNQQRGVQPGPSMRRRFVDDVRPRQHAPVHPQPSSGHDIVQQHVQYVERELVTVWQHLARMLQTAGHSWATGEHDVLLTPVHKVQKFVKRYMPQHMQRWQVAYFTMLVVALAAIPVSILAHNSLQAQRYVLSAATQKLVGGPVTVLDEQLSYDAKTQQFRYNPSAVNGIQAATGSSGNSATIGGSKYYGVDVAKEAARGQTYTDAQTKLSFTLVPQFGQLNGKHVDGHLVYPYDNGQVVYSLKANGLKEDVVVTEPTNSLRLSYKLQLPDSLEARLSQDGSVGIYSADPSLFGNISYGSDKDQQAVAKARQNSQKTNLVFTIPAPVVVESGTVKGGSQAKFSLDGDLLTVAAVNLQNLSYPISIDPSVIVQSANTFSAGNNEDGNAAISAGSVGRSAISGGTLGSYSSAGTSFTTPAYGISSAVLNGYLYVFSGNTAGGGSVNTTQYAQITGTGTLASNAGCGTAWCSTSTFSTARQSFGAVAYNGYLYVIGGIASGGGSLFADVQYAQPASNGAIPASGPGAWITNTNSLVNARGSTSVVVYNGYLYVLGGCGAVLAGCSGVRSDVQYAKINADGSTGVWHYTHNSTDDGVTSVGGFTTARKALSAVAYNGYVYIMGGCNANCSTSQADVQYAALNANGTVGTWATTSALPANRQFMGAVVAGGYIYITGGGAQLNDTIYAPINANGAVGAWYTTSLFTTGRYQHTSVAYNGYVYVIGGCSNGSTNCDAPAGELADVQYAKIDSPGVAGSFNTVPSTGGTLSSTLYNSAAVATGGYLYLFGGADNAANGSNVIQYASVNTDGTLGAWANMSAGSGPTFVGARLGASAVAYNGYIYISGGRTTSAGTMCSDVQFAKINPANGTFSTNWTDALTGGAAACTNADMLNGQPGNFAGRQNHQMLAYNGYLYIVGGITNNNTNTLADVQFAPMNSNGTLGAFHYTHANTDDNTTYVSGLNTARNAFGTVIANGYVYVLGGKTSANNNTATSSVEAAPIQSNGTVGTWNGTTAGTMPNGIARFMFAYGLSNGMLYVSGGMHNTSDTACTNGSANTLCNDTWYTPICNGVNSTGGCTAGTAGTLGTWVQTNYFTTARGDPQGAIYNGYLYIMGGGTGNPAQYVCTSGLGGCTMQTDVQYAPLNNGGGGAPTGWASTAGSIPAALAGTGVAAYNGFIYKVSGCNSILTGTCNGLVAANTAGNAQYAAVGANGAVGTWTNATNFPASLYDPSATIYNGYLYVMTGCTNGGCTARSANYYYVAICTGVNTNGGCTTSSPAGSLGTWNSGTINTYATGRFGTGATAYNGYLYIAGGYDGAFYNDVYKAQINSDGSLGTWASAGANYTTARAYNAVVANNGYLYIVGGQSGSTTYVNDVQFIPINATTGALTGSWAATTGFSIPRTTPAVNIYNGYMYLTSGAAASSFYNDVQYAPITSNGQLGNWTVTPGYNGANASALGRWLESSVIVNGYIYVIAGIRSDGSLGSDIQYAPIQALSRVAHYSRLIDLKSTVGASFGGDPQITRYVFKLSAGGPTALGLSGVGLCASGATSVAATFGTALCYTNMVPSTPVTYKSFGRYSFAFITIDDSLSSTFPDSAQTTLSELDMYFHASPQRRLRGGQTFIDTNGGTTNTRNQLDTEGP